jgi:cell division protein FtsQ
MKFKFNIKRELKIGVSLLIVGLLIGFSERRRDGVVVSDVQVKLNNIESNHFLDEQDVVKLMDVGTESLKGARYGDLDMRTLEERIKSERFVSDADIYSDLKGNLVVNVSLRRPIARLVRNDGPDGYIAADGTIMPVSDKYSTRVVVVSGSFVNQLIRKQSVYENELGAGLMEMLNKVQEDDFLRPLIAGIDMDSKGKITFYPQVGDQLIEFGKPENLDVKFRKLKIFYKEILPARGWNRYSRVNLEYESQIVAE